jgi:hypothetical protein
LCVFAIGVCLCFGHWQVELLFSPSG